MWECKCNPAAARQQLSNLAVALLLAAFASDPGGFRWLMLLINALACLNEAVLWSWGQTNWSLEKRMMCGNASCIIQTARPLRLAQHGLLWKETENEGSAWGPGTKYTCERASLKHYHRCAAGEACLGFSSVYFVIWNLFHFKTGQAKMILNTLQPK